MYSADEQNRIARLVEIRNNSLSQRVINVFLEIDHLGNYTQISWFNSLTINGYIRLYRNLYDIWYLRSNMPRETRLNICPLQNPFSNQRMIGFDLDQVKTACIEVFENLVYTGIDDEHRKLGAFHALTALTIVSLGARDAMPWLYESVSIY
jgi:hypothetical protein